MDIEEIKKELADVIITMIVLSKLQDVFDIQGDWVEVVDYIQTDVDVDCNFLDTVSSYIAVKINNIAVQYKLNVWECLEYKYNIVAKREGKVVNGTFVKKKKSLMEKLKEDMEKKKMLRTHLAQITGYSEGNLSRIWNHKLIPSVENYERMRKAVDEY